MYIIYTIRALIHRRLTAQYVSPHTHTHIHNKHLHAFMNVQVEPSAFVIHKTKSWLGATPDGTVGESGLVEIKAPIYQLYGEVPPHYMAQVITA